MPLPGQLSVQINSEASGGTGQALRIAATRGVPVYNLQRDRERAHVERHLVL